MGSDCSIIDKMEKVSTDIWGGMIRKSFDTFTLFIPEEDFQVSYGETEESIGAVSGYVRYDNFQNPLNGREDISFYHNRRFLSEVINKNSWPLGDNITGSFSAVSFSKVEKKVILCNDVIGYLPLYYKECPQGMLGGTSLVILGKCFSSEVDITGVLQRVTSFYYNFGKRTLLKNVLRLLPGEKLIFSPKNNIKSSSFDNTLYTGSFIDNLDEASGSVWNLLKQEINIVVESRKKINITLSGGWDSRLILGGMLSHNRKIVCHTYGDKELFESKIAKQCADFIGSPIHYYNIENTYFPSRKEIEWLVNKTESASFLQWFNLIRSQSNKGKPLILTGDFSDCLDGRNYLEFHTRKMRRKWFLKRLIGRKEKFVYSDLNKFKEWKENKKNEILNNIVSNAPKLSGLLKNEISEKTIIEETELDLKQIFRRIEDNLPPFTVQFDEIFRWYHYTRYYQSSQLLQLASSFYPISPAMSIKMIRYSTNIHPKLKLRRKLLNTISKQPEFDGLREIPTTTIPLVKTTSPVILQELIWAGRHYLDYIFIKRMLKTKNIYKRQRFLKSQNTITEYRRNDTVLNVSEWFSGKWINSSSYIELIEKRADFSKWPSINNDIVIPANVSIILDLIYG